MHYLILCYDISENKIRTRLYNYLLKSGSIPLQKSVHISYNINCTSLIESISYYPKIFDYDLGIYPTSNTLRATYTFDTANNNRVTKMAVENVNAQTKMVYTFYYKN